MSQIFRTGFGQVEPNHLSAQRTAQIYAQLPASDALEILENGQFVKYNYVDKVVCNMDEEVEKPEIIENAKGEWMMVFNEVKLYEGSIYRESYKDWAMIKDNYTPGTEDIQHGGDYLGVEDEEGNVPTYPVGPGPLRGQMVPRVIKTNVGDIYTTNCLGMGNTSGKAKVEGIAVEEGDILSPNAQGFLAADGDETIQFQVVKIYTMADGQPAVKLMRIA